MYTHTVNITQDVSQAAGRDHLEKGNANTKEHEQ